MQSKKEQKLVKKITEKLNCLDEHQLTALIVLLAGVKDTYSSEDEDENENIFTDEDDKLKNKRVPFVEPDDEGNDEESEDDDEETDESDTDEEEPDDENESEEDDDVDESDDDEDDGLDDEDDDDEEPVKKSKSTKKSKKHVDEDDDDDDDDEDLFEESDEDYDIEVEESDDDDDDEEPVKKKAKKSTKSSKKVEKKASKKVTKPAKKVKTKKVKFDYEDYDTWTEDNMKGIESYLSDDAGVNIKKSLGSLKGKARIAKAIKLDKETTKIDDKLEGMKTKQLLDMAKKAKLKVTGKSEKAQRKKAIELLYALQVANLK